MLACMCSSKVLGGGLFIRDPQHVCGSLWNGTPYIQEVCEEHKCVHANVGLGNELVCFYPKLFNVMCFKIAK